MSQGIPVPGPMGNTGPRGYIGDRGAQGETGFNPKFADNAENGILYLSKVIDERFIHIIKYKC
jgi:hypothetical protein